MVSCKLSLKPIHWQRVVFGKLKWIKTQLSLPESSWHRWTYQQFWGSPGFCKALRAAVQNWFHHKSKRRNCRLSQLRYVWGPTLSIILYHMIFIDILYTCLSHYIPLNPIPTCRSTKTPCPLPGQDFFCHLQSKVLVAGRSKRRAQGQSLPDFVWCFWRGFVVPPWLNLIRFISTTYQTYVYIYISTIHQPYINHISTIYQPYTNHTSTIYQPYTNHIPTIWTHMDQLQALQTLLDESTWACRNISYPNTFI